MIILNGGSSSGKSELARSLQAVLPEPWLTLGVDTLIEAMPAALSEASTEGIAFDADGGVAIGPVFREIEDAWIEGVAAMARAGARIIVDEVFLGGAESQSRWRKAVAGLRVCWVGVRCAPEVAAARETARGDRAVGMAALQAESVHRGVEYDLVVDTSADPSVDCARLVAAWVD